MLISNDTMTSELPFEKLNRKILVRKEALTDKNFGSYPDKRDTETLLKYGIINIDKPKGPTSHQVSDFLQKILNIEKAGHSGTLDPAVTGVLPVAYGKATRIVQFLLKAGKEYVCLMHLHNKVEKEVLLKGIKDFTGSIRQLPPIKSAVKRRLRWRNVYYAEVLGLKEQDVLVKIGCQAGTYIRKWCHDLGEHLGVGAHMAELRRTKAGPFSESSLAYLQDVADAMHYYKKGDDTKLREIIQPIESAVQHLPHVWVFDSTVDSLCHGAALGVPGISKVHAETEKDQLVAVMTLKNELVGVGKAMLTSKKMLENKGVAVQMSKVFMEPGTYPQRQKIIKDDLKKE